MFGESHSRPMSPYRTAVAEVVGVAVPRRHRLRTPVIMSVVVAAHVGLLAVAFVRRSPEPAKTPETTEIVQVLVGHVDLSMTSPEGVAWACTNRPEPRGFEATGMFSARVTKQAPRP